MEDPGNLDDPLLWMLRLCKAHKEPFIHSGFELLSLIGRKFLIYEKSAGRNKAIFFMNMSEHEGEPPVAVPAPDAEALVQDA